MTRGLMLAVLALLLGLTGATSLGVGLYERRLAEAEIDFGALSLDESMRGYLALSDQLRRAPWRPPSGMATIEAGRDGVRYWQGDYRALAETATMAAAQPNETSADLALVAANALYREAQRGAQDRTTLLPQLDDALRAYAEVLRLGPTSPDAAFNYEFVVRMRTEIAAGRRRRLPDPGTADPWPAGRLHGRPGGQPDGEATREFRVRIPRDARGTEQSPAEAAGTGFTIRKPG